MLRTHELEARGLSRAEIRRRVDRGELVKLARGVYAEAGHEITEHHDLAIVAARVPRAVVCLLSALAFHELTTQSPHEVWIALPPRVWRPVIPEIALQVVRFSGARLSDGVEQHTIEGVTVRVYDVAKTVVDVFRYRNKLGLDVAVDALREALRERRCTRAEVARYARRSRVLSAMTPYIEAVA